MMEIEEFDVGKRISDLRKLKGYSVNKLANLSGVSQSYLRDVELGKKNPTVTILSYICRALNISLKEFFDDDTVGKLQNSLTGKIYKLTPKQKDALERFIDTIIK